jgi:hypothetical protein
VCGGVSSVGKVLVKEKCVCRLELNLTLWVKVLVRKKVCSTKFASMGEGFSKRKMCIEGV